jgi:N-acyl-D-aspartate/D-glutamate deacylase
MTHDLIIRRGLIVDGTGAEPSIGDVAIDGDAIVALGAGCRSSQEDLHATG